MSINRQDILDFGRMGIKKWEKKNAELLSCYDSKKLREIMGTFSELESDVNPVRDLLNEPGFGDLSENKQIRAAISAIDHSFNVIFNTLFSRGALDRLLVVSETTDEAEQQVERIREEIADYEQEQHDRQQQAAAIAAAPVEVVEDPHDVCVRDFHEMGSAAFKAKYISNQSMRQVYENVVAAGRV
jgi:hypothetical protein